MSLIPAPIVLTDAGNMKECMNNMYLKTQGILNNTTTTNLSLNEGMKLSNSSTSSTFTQSSSGDLTISNATGTISINPTTSFSVASDGNIVMSSGGGGVQISSPNDYINFITPNSTYFNTATELTGDGIIYCQNIINPTSITNQAPLITQTDGINPNFISMDLQTSSTQNPLITLTKHSSILGTITENDNGMEIQTIQEMNVIAEKRMIIYSQNDNTILYNPIGSVFVDRTGTFSGDGDIYASNFYGNASTATSSTSATNATNIQVNNTSANLNHYLTFANSNTTGYKLLQATNGLIFNPNSNTLTTTTFSGALSGNASTCSIATNINTSVDNTTSSNCPIHFGTTTSGSQSTKVNIAGLYYRPNVNILNCNFEGSLTGTATNGNAINLTSDNTSGTYYIPFSKLSAGSARQLYIDDTTGPLSYNPSTSTLTATNFNGLCSTTGLVFLQTLTGTITGAVGATTYTLPSIFNTTYKNYKIQLTFGENSYLTYPSISLNGFSGTNVPTTGDLYGVDMVSSAVSAVSVANATLSSSPLQLTGAFLPNIQVEFEVFNVGYTTLQSNNMVRIVSNSIYFNPGVKGIRNVQAVINQNSSSTITGLSLQSIFGTGNNANWTAKIYGYK